MPSAIPIAAATPIAGAPRITIVLIALATSCAVRHVTYTSDAGSLRWSIITTVPPVQSIVGSIGLNDISAGPAHLFVEPREYNRAAWRNRPSLPIKRRSKRAPSRIHEAAHI